MGLGSLNADQQYPPVVSRQHFRVGSPKQYCLAKAFENEASIKFVAIFDSRNALYAKHNPANTGQFDAPDA